MKETTNIKQFISLPPVTSLATNGKSIWIGTTKGLWQLNIAMNRLDRILEDFVTDLQYVHDSHELWITTWMTRGLITVRNAKTIQIIGFPTEQIYDRALIRQHSLYCHREKVFVATDAGLFCYQQGKWHEVLNDHAFIRIRGIGQTVWGIADEGSNSTLYHFRETHLQKRLPLPVDVDSDLIVQNSKIWFSGQHRGNIYVYCSDGSSGNLKRFSTGIISASMKETVGCTDIRLLDGGFLLGVGSLSMTSLPPLSGVKGGLYRFNIGEQAHLLCTDRRLRNVIKILFTSSAYWIGTDKGLARLALL